LIRDILDDTFLSEKARISESGKDTRLANDFEKTISFDRFDFLHVS